MNVNPTDTLVSETSGLMLHALPVLLALVVLSVVFRIFARALRAGDEVESVESVAALSSRIEDLEWRAELLWDEYFDREMGRR